jgi:hypothetical protein
MSLSKAGLSSTLSVTAVAALFAVGCGGVTTDITAAVKDTNNNLKGQGAKMTCPDTVDGDTGTKFDCTLKGTETGESAKVHLKLIKDGIAPVSQQDYVSAVKQVSS